MTIVDLAEVRRERAPQDLIGIDMTDASHRQVLIGIANALGEFYGPFDRLAIGERLTIEIDFASKTIKLG